MASNDNGTNRSYRVDPTDEETRETLKAADMAGREFETDPDAQIPDDETVILRTTDGDGPIDGLGAHERSDRWNFYWLDSEKPKYRRLEVRGARGPGSLVRGEAPVEVNGEERYVDIYLELPGSTRATLRDSPGHMEPQLSTAMRTAAQRLEAEAEAAEADAPEEANDGPTPAITPVSGD